ncbi:hypothetical protein BDV18DRAFT_141021 [Aspergillus unguis]
MLLLERFTSCSLFWPLQLWLPCLTQTPAVFFVTLVHLAHWLSNYWWYFRLRSYSQVA